MLQKLFGEVESEDIPKIYSLLLFTTETRMAILFFFSFGNDLHPHTSRNEWEIALGCGSRRRNLHKMKLGKMNFGIQMRVPIIACTFADRLPNKGS